MDDKLEWSKSFYYTGGTATCGAAAYGEEVVPVELTFRHYGQGVKFHFKSALNEAHDNEVRAPPPASASAAVVSFLAGIVFFFSSSSSSSSSSSGAT